MGAGQEKVALVYTPLYIIIVICKLILSNGTINERVMQMDLFYFCGVTPDYINATKMWLYTWLEVATFNHLHAPVSQLQP